MCISSDDDSLRYRLGLRTHPTASRDCAIGRLVQRLLGSIVNRLSVVKWPQVVVVLIRLLVVVLREGAAVPNLLASKVVLGALGGIGVVVFQSWVFNHISSYSFLGHN